MCGRFNLRTTPAALQSLFGSSIETAPIARYNIAPTQSTLVCRLVDGQRELIQMRWGLIPSWAKDTKIGYKLINARSETVAEKPSFRAAYKRRRCLIPLSGFYEWLRDGKEKRPFHIHRVDDSLFAVAGLWEVWEGLPETDNSVEQHRIESFTILTTAANTLLTPIHNRMPVLLPANLFEVWLSDDVDPAALAELLLPYEWNGFERVPVSDVANNARNETPECLEPPPKAQGTFWE